MYAYTKEKKKKLKRYCNGQVRWIEHRWGRDDKREKEEEDATRNMTKESLPVWLTGFIEQETFCISCAHHEHRGSFKDAPRVSSILLLFLLLLFLLLISPLHRILCFLVLSIPSSSSSPAATMSGGRNKVTGNRPSGTLPPSGAILY